MEESIQQSDLILTFCSQAALQSGLVKQELEMALYLDKLIIPIFEYEEDMSRSLKIKRGIKFNPAQINEMIEKLFTTLKINPTLNLLEN